MEVIINCIPGDAYQLFPCLESISNTRANSCKFILEYPEEFELSPPNNKEEFKKYFGESHQIQKRDLSTSNGGYSDGVSVHAQVSRTSTERYVES